MPVAGMDASRTGKIGVGNQETKAAGSTVQLQALSQYADKVFYDLSALIDSFDSRVTKLTAKVASDSVKENLNSREQRNLSAAPYDKKMKHISYMKSDIVSLLNPDSRDERTATSYLCAQSVALPLLKKLDRLIELVMTREQTEACAKGFSDPSFFLTKWQSEEEARYIEIQTERLTRRGERHQRRLSETKCGDDLSSNGDTTTAFRLPRIEELEVSDSDSEIDYPLFGSHDVSCASSVVPDDDSSSPRSKNAIKRIVASAVSDCSDRHLFGRILARETSSSNSGISSSIGNKPPLKPQRPESVTWNKDDAVGSSKFPSGKKGQFS